MRLMLVICLFGIYTSLFAQDEDGISFIEETTSNTETEFEDESIIADLEYLLIYPININDTLQTTNIFFEYGLLTPFQWEQLVEYIREYGPLKSKQELLAIPKITSAEIKRLKPYITLGEEEAIMAKRSGQHKLIFRDQYIFEDQKGYDLSDSVRNRYVGSRHKHYLKYGYKDGVQSFGLLADKDPGEAFLRENNKAGFDFYSFHYFRAFNGKIKAVVLGDYEKKIGQGLLQWNGFSLGKGANTTAIHKQGRDVKPFTSTNEYNFMRGVSSLLDFGKIEVSPWVSYKLLDANFSVDTIDDRILLSTLKEDGLHRTPAEIEDKNAYHEITTGSTLTYKGNKIDVGIAAKYTKLNQEVLPTDRPYKKYDFSGNSLLNASIFYNGIGSNFYYFGETAFDQNGSIATLHGLQAFLNNGVTAVISGRYYDKKYHSFYTDGFAESTATQNETGVYLGVNYGPIPKLKVEAYADIFYFPWLRFRVDKPSNGQEYFLRATYEANKNLALELRTKWEHKEINISGNNTLPQNPLTAQVRMSNRLELRYKPSQNLYLKSRLSHARFSTNQKDENGYLLFQDAVYQFDSINLKLHGRLAVFNTPSFDSRIYAYENDLLYNFNIPSYFNKGSRWYAMASYKPSRQVSLWLRFSQTIFDGAETISSGLNEIEGNKRTDVRAQVLWKFNARKKQPSQTE